MQTGCVYGDNGIVQISISTNSMFAAKQVERDEKCSQGWGYGEAANYIVYSQEAFYQNIFNNLTISFSTIDQFLRT